MKVRGIAYVTISIATMLLFACGASEGSPDQSVGGEETIPASTMEPARPIDSQDLLDALTPGSIGFLETLADQGTITFAVYPGPESYWEQEDGSITGFDYQLSQFFAELWGVKARYYVLDELSEFFAAESGYDPAVTTDPELRYTPALFDQVDIYAAPLTILPWREKLMTMVDLFPAGIALTGPEAATLGSFADLDGATVAIPEDGFQEGIFTAWEDAYGIRLNRRYFNSSEDVYELLEGGFAEFTLDGSLFVVRGVERYPTMEVAGFTVDLVPVGWGVETSRTELARLLKESVVWALETGRLGDIWTNTMGINFNDYLDVLSQ